MLAMRLNRNAIDSRTVVLRQLELGSPTPLGDRSQQVKPSWVPPNCQFKRPYFQGLPRDAVHDSSSYHCKLELAEACGYGLDSDGSVYIGWVTCGRVVIGSGMI